MLARRGSQILAFTRRDAVRLGILVEEHGTQGEYEFLFSDSVPLEHREQGRGTRTCLGEAEWLAGSRRNVSQRLPRQVAATTH